MRTVFGSEFQIDGAEERKARFAKVVVVDGRHLKTLINAKSKVRPKFGLNSF